MQKHLFGMLFLAFVLSSITVASKLIKNEPLIEEEITFVYNNSSYSEADVEDPQNWVEVQSAGCGPCNNINQKACRMRVKASATEGTAPNRTLKSSAVIPAQFHVGCGTYYIVVGGDVIWVCNRSCN